MFNDSKYTKLYYTLIEKFSAQQKSMGYEKHHIIPKSCGGTNEDSNLAIIPSRVHFILHKLLPKMSIDKTHLHKMQYALWRMMNPQSRHHVRNYVVRSSEYARQKEYVRKSMLGPKNVANLYPNKNNFISNNPMLRPEIASMFRRKRPEQSIVATNRNNEYWKDKKLPLIKKTCLTCGIEFDTKRVVARYCTKKCARLAYRKSAS